MMGRESHDSNLLHKLTGSHVAYGIHTWQDPFWVEQSFIRFYNFFRLLPFSALLLMANQGGNRTSKVSESYIKLLMLRIGQKLAKTKTMDTLHYKYCSYCWGQCFLLPVPPISIVLIKKLLFSCVNNVALEVFTFEKLNFSKTTVAYGTF